jgi:hypothetical protein
VIRLSFIRQKRSSKLYNVCLYYSPEKLSSYLSSKGELGCLGVVIDFYWITYMKYSSTTHNTFMKQEIMIVNMCCAVLCFSSTRSSRDNVDEIIVDLGFGVEVSSCRPGKSNKTKQNKNSHKFYILFLLPFFFLIRTVCRPETTTTTKISILTNKTKTKNQIISYHIKNNYKDLNMCRRI